MRTYLIWIPLTLLVQRSAGKGLGEPCSRFAFPPDCDEGLLCVARTCQEERAGLGEPCYVNSDCREGLRCTVNEGKTLGECTDVLLTEGKACVFGDCGENLQCGCFTPGNNGDCGGRAATGTEAVGMWGLEKVALAIGIAVLFSATSVQVLVPKSPNFRRVRQRRRPCQIRRLLSCRNLRILQLRRPARLNHFWYPFCLSQSGVSRQLSVFVSLSLDLTNSKSENSAGILSLLR